MTCDLRLGRVVGLPAVLGERLMGHVERAVLDEGGKQLQGLVLRRGLGGARWAGREEIRLLGDVSVILRARPGRPPRSADFCLRAVKDESGLTLGRVTDVFVCPETLAVTALEVSLGLMEELLQGRRIIRRWTVRTDAEDGPQVLIPREAWEHTDKPEGGDAQ